MSNSTFQLLDDGTMFTGRYYWENDTHGLTCAAGVWLVEDIEAVSTLPDTQIPEMPAPRCAITIQGSVLWLQAEFSEVQAAWRAYRRRHQSEIKGVRFTPFSAS